MELGYISTSVVVVISNRKTLVEGWSVWMNGSPILPALDMQVVSRAAEVMLPSSMPRLMAAAVRLVVDSFFWAVRVHFAALHPASLC